MKGGVYRMLTVINGIALINWLYLNYCASAFFTLSMASFKLGFSTRA